MPRNSGVQVVFLSRNLLEATRPPHSLETPLEIHHLLHLVVLCLVGEVNNGSKPGSAVPVTQALVVAPVEEATSHRANFLRKGGVNLGTTVTSLMISVLVGGAILPLVAEEASDQPIPISATTRRLDGLADKQNDRKVSSLDHLFGFEY